MVTLTVSAEVQPANSSGQGDMQLSIYPRNNFRASTVEITGDLTNIMVRDILIGPTSQLWRRPLTENATPLERKISDMLGPVKVVPFPAECLSPGLKLKLNLDMVRESLCLTIVLENLGSTPAKVSVNYIGEYVVQKVDDIIPQVPVPNGGIVINPG